MSDPVLVALIVAGFGTINAIITARGQKKIMASTTRTEELVNGHSTKQAEEIRKLNETVARQVAEVAKLRHHIAGEET